ncbi:hypothetical protein CCP2SC5_490010 [Azospirillaceae bacterium]
MTGAFFLDNLSIQAFRGFDKPQILDFSAPLTLICAANGSGKTSLCEAIEWLLLGRVDRLGNNDLRCCLSPEERSTEVKSLLRTMEGHVEILRTPERVLIGDGQKKKTLKEMQLLDRLVPLTKSAAQSAQREADIRRQWLGGARFFSGERVAVLLDNDEDQQQSRIKILADLLGTKDWLAYQEKLSNIAESLHQKATPLNKDIQQLNGQIQILANAASLERTSILREGALAYRRLLEILGADVSSQPSTSAESFQTLVNGAERLVAEQQNHSKSVRAALNEVREKWTNPETWTIEDDRKKLISVKNTIFLLESQYNDVRRREEKLNQLITWLDDLSKLNIDQETSIITFFERSSSINFDLTMLNIEARQTEYCLSQVERFNAVKAQLTTMTETLSKNDLANLDPVVFYDQIRQETIRLGSLQQALKNVADPLSRLQHLALHVLETLADDHHCCPACGHNWGSVVELRAAISQGGASATTIITDLTQQIQEVEMAISKIRTLAENAERCIKLNSERDAFLAQVSKLQLPTDAQVDQAILMNHLQYIRQAIIMKKLKESLETFSSSGWIKLPIAQIFSAILQDIDIQEKLSYEISLNMEKAKKEVDRLEVRIRSLENVLFTWSFLAKDTTPTNEALADIEHKAVERERSLADAEGILDVLRTCLRQLKQRELTLDLEKKRDKAQRQYDAFIAEKNRIMSFIEKISSHRVAFERRQIQALENVMNSLFIRMQANEMFNRVVSSRDGASMRWSASAGDESTFDTKAHFSQGQRQDMALALFFGEGEKLRWHFYTR